MDGDLDECLQFIPKWLTETARRLPDSELLQLVIQNTDNQSLRERGLYDALIKLANSNTTIETDGANSTNHN